MFSGCSAYVTFLQVPAAQMEARDGCGNSLSLFTSHTPPTNPPSLLLFPLLSSSSSGLHMPPPSVLTPIPHKHSKENASHYIYAEKSTWLALEVITNGPVQCEKCGMISKPFIGIVSEGRSFHLFEKVCWAKDKAVVFNIMGTLLLLLPLLAGALAR